MILDTESERQNLWLRNDHKTWDPQPQISLIPLGTRKASYDIFPVSLFLLFPYDLIFKTQDKCQLLWEFFSSNLYNLDSILKIRDITMLTKVHLVKAMVFPVVMYGCESWTVKKAECQKNWCFWTVVLEKTLESPLDCKEIQPVHPRGDQSWVFIGRTDAEGETPVLWPPHAKSWLIGKDPDAGRDWGQEEKGTTEDEMVGWHHRLDGHGFE